MKSIILILTLLLIANNANARQCPKGIAPYYRNHSICGAGQKAKNVQLCDNNCNCSWVTQCYNVSVITPQDVTNGNWARNRNNRYYNGY